MSGYRKTKIRYIDASALIKLVVDEDDCAKFREFFRNNVNFCTTSLCLSEALSRIKGLWKKGKDGRTKLTMEEYLTSTRNLLGNTHTLCKPHGKIEIDENILSDASVHLKVEEIARDNKLDLSDALQLYTIKNGKYSHLGPESASILITADKELASVAKAMGIRAWNCSKESAPEWA
ncbi:MAG: type II toxin-antitoxin system VapC family toxin [Methylococcaceae bacterium]